MVLNSGVCTVFGIERKWHEAGENYIVRSFVIAGWRIWGLNLMFARLSWRGDLYLLQNVQTSSGAHLASCSMNTMILFTGINRSEREIDQSRPLVPKLRMNGAVPFFRRYNFNL
jgi:hypothetical protein